MGEYLTERHIAEFKDAYSLIDKNKEQSINTKNLGSMMRALKMDPTEVELRDMINEVDADGSGDIDFPEFLAMMAQRKKREELDAEIEETFKLFDLDKDGLINEKELKEVMTAMGEIVSDDEVRQIMSEANQSGNNGICLEDFRKMFDTLLPAF